MVNNIDIVIGGSGGTTATLKSGHGMAKKCQNNSAGSTPCSDVFPRPMSDIIPTLQYPGYKGGKNNVRNGRGKIAKITLLLKSMPGKWTTPGDRREREGGSAKQQNEPDESSIPKKEQLLSRGETQAVADLSAGCILHYFIFTYCFDILQSLNLFISAIFVLPHLQSCDFFGESQLL